MNDSTETPNTIYDYELDEAAPDPLAWWYEACPEPRVCPLCDGSGLGSETVHCPHCGGDGVVCE